MLHNSPNHDITRHIKGSLPSNTETNSNQDGKAQCQSISLHNGKELHEVTKETAKVKEKEVEGIIEEILDKVNKFIFHADFAVLDIEANRRPFLATSGTLIDIKKGIIEEILDKVNKFIFHADFAVLDIEANRRPFLATSGTLIDIKKDLEVVKILDLLNNLNSKRVEHLEMPTPSKVLKPPIEEPPMIGLKPFRDHLCDAYLGKSDTLPVIISSSLSYVHRMSFGLYNASATFQRCMIAIFTDMINNFLEVFMDNFSVYRNSFDECLNSLSNVLKRYKDTNFVLN
ncbi:DNA-directed DNA polymerase [Handroanthus impetiginosus]|uniref:DNA-directed DNA polymerase n=1 Tax=Handroanthus impetiginosus TaxID=429701 RepID=A0A2G9G838_9LAMI|nr:DNA-directed DNA polymerase [Handroanthus impetiginosus]